MSISETFATPYTRSESINPIGCRRSSLSQVNDKLLTLDRVKKTKRGYTETSQDHIVNSSADDEAAYGFAYAESDKKKTETILKTGETIEEGTTPQILYAKQVKAEGEEAAEVSIPAKKQTEELYYVYAKGHLLSVPPH